MLKDAYFLDINENETEYRFNSIGHHGVIQKKILFQKSEISQVYNLAFGDILDDEIIINDQVISNNGDMPKVLATIHLAIQYFLQANPTSFVYLTGNTESRIRLYRIAITKVLEQEILNLVVAGELELGFERFKPNTNYQGFIIKFKN